MMLFFSCTYSSMVKKVAIAASYLKTEIHNCIIRNVIHHGYIHKHIEIQHAVFLKKLNYFETIYIKKTFLTSNLSNEDPALN